MSPAAVYGSEKDDKRINHSKAYRRSSGGGGSGLAGAIHFLMSCIVLFGLICFIEKVQCVIQQQEQSPSGAGEQNSLMNNDIGNGNQVIIRLRRRL